MKINLKDKVDVKEGDIVKTDHGTYMIVHQPSSVNHKYIRVNMLDGTVVHGESSIKLLLSGHTIIHVVKNNNIELNEI